MTEKDNTQEEDHVNISSDIILENHREYSDNETKFYNEDALEKIKKYNKNNPIESLNSTNKELCINKKVNSPWSLVKMTNRFKMSPLVLYHIIQWRTAKKQSNGTSQPAFTVDELKKFCQEKIKSYDTIDGYLDILEDADLITRKQIGRTNSIELTDQTVGPVFDRYYETDTPPTTIKPFESTPSDRFDLGIGTPSANTARGLFENEIHAGKRLLAFWGVLVAWYIVMLSQGYPFVEKAGTHYLLTLMGLVGGLAVGVGLIRRWAASVGFHRPVF